MTIARRAYAATLVSKRHELAKPEFCYPYGSIFNFMLLTGANPNPFLEIHPKLGEMVICPAHRGD
jgi:hypothetical protein